MWYVVGCAVYNAPIRISKMALMATDIEKPIIRSLFFLIIDIANSGNGIINKKAKINEEMGFAIKKPKLYIIP